VEKNDQSLPRRLIITYRTMSGQPSVIAELSDWNFSIHPSDEEFVFHPPKDAVKLAPEPISTGTKAPQKGARP